MLIFLSVILVFLKKLFIYIWDYFWVIKISEEWIKSFKAIKNDNEKLMYYKLAKILRDKNIIWKNCETTKFN